MKRLGKVQRTSRGFELIEFKDLYGYDCSLQASSLADKSALWLGCEHESIHSVTGEQIGARMHLDRKQVAALINHLANWLDKKSFKITKERP